MLLLFLLLPHLTAQAEIRLQQIHIVDPSSQPLAGVQAHTRDDGIDRRTLPVSDAAGTVRVFTAFPVLLRKPGYHSLLLTQPPAAPVAMTLAPSGRFPLCGHRANTIGIDDGLSRLRVRWRELRKASRIVRDFDYSDRLYMGRRLRGILSHGAGPMWSLGWPAPRDVWQSANYSETVYRLGDYDTLIDARGISPDGKLWRQQYRFGETLGYRTPSSTAAAELDAILDSTCLAR